MRLLISELIRVSALVVVSTISYSYYWPELLIMGGIIPPFLLMPNAHTVEFYYSLTSVVKHVHFQKF